MKKILLSNMLLASLLWSNGCAASVRSSARINLPEKEYDVYVAGEERNSDEKISAVKIWKNGVSMYHNQPNGQEGLSDTYADIYSVFVSGNDVYAAGNENRKGRYPGAAVVWKNGVPLYDHENNGSKSLMPSNREFSLARTVLVSEGDVYVLGSSHGVENKKSNIISVWKNGELLYDIVPDEKYKFSGGGGFYGFSMFVSGEDTYVAGDVRVSVSLGGMEGFANVWKNGKPLYYNGPDGAEGLTEIGHFNIASSVFVSGEDVYVAGMVRRDKREIVMVWKNGISLYNNGMNRNEGLTDGRWRAYAHSLFVSGDDIYVAGEQRMNCENNDGSQNKTIGMVWKNGKSLYRNGINGSEGLTGGNHNSRANAIFVSGDDVFVAGEIWRMKDNSIYRSAAVWKNGVLLYGPENGNQKNSTDGMLNGKAVSIFVVPRN